jgi:PTH1 family peptidyl-tRNA hydrolase
VTTQGELLVVGLGNPGSRYEGTRHNVGAEAVELLADRLGERLREDRKVSARVAGARVDGARLHLAVPHTYMNESGRAVAQLVRRHPLDDWSRLVVVHDELDIDPGELKVKLGGGLAGNNGLRSIAEHLGTRDFARVRIGIGKPRGGPGRGADWVLSRPHGAERDALAVAVQLAADAVEAIAVSDVSAAMQRFNARRP